MTYFALSSVRVSDVRDIWLRSDDLPEQGIYFDYGDTEYGEMGLERMEDMIEEVPI